MSTKTIVSAELVEFQTSMDAYHVENARRGQPEYEMTRSRLMQFATCPARWKDGWEFGGNAGTRHGTLVDLMVRDEQDGITVKPETYPAKVKLTKARQKEWLATQAEETGLPVEQLPDPPTHETVIKQWNGNADACKAWLVEHEDKLVVTRKELEKAGAADMLIRNHEEFGAILKSSLFAALVTGVYRDPDTGIEVPIKTAIDIVPDDQTALVDLKTGRSAEPRAWTRACWSYGYDLQGAMNLDLWNPATGENRHRFKHLIQENEFPYHTTYKPLSDEFVHLGRIRYLAALKRYCQCLSSGDWPGYAGDEIVPEEWMTMVGLKLDQGIEMDRMIPDWAMEAGDE